MKLAALILLVLLTGCAVIDSLTLPPAPVVDEYGVVDDGFLEGAVTTPPFGYSKHCRDYPNSVFCK